MQEKNTKAHPLSGDRAIEWSWVTRHLPAQPSLVLDLGCVGSSLTGIASRLGHQVTAVDLNDIEYEMPRVTFRKGDIYELYFDGKFDVIINCSLIEHVGLENRYGSVKRNDGDLLIMAKLSRLLTSSGKMILTIPVGLDTTFAPFHRIYGTERLP
ncbi:class I SAM-dependent methyltransferase, partial [Thermodesulfobacteriota bacterium]